MLRAFAIAFLAMISSLAARADGYVDEEKCFGGVVPSVAVGATATTTVAASGGGFFSVAAFRQACNTDPSVYVLILQLRAVVGSPSALGLNLTVQQGGVSYRDFLFVKNPSSNSILDYLLVGQIGVSSVIVRQNTTRFDVAGKLHLVFGDASVGTVSIDLPAITTAPPSASITVFGGNLSDMWWNAAENGTGLSIVHHGSNQLFVVWYTYDDAGSPLWLVASGGTWSADGKVFTGALFRTKGTSFKLPWNQGAFSVGAQYGTMTLIVQDADHLLANWSAGGVSGTKTYTRLRY